MPIVKSVSTMYIFDTGNVIFDKVGLRQNKKPLKVLELRHMTIMTYMTYKSGYISVTVTV